MPDKKRYKIPEVSVYSKGKVGIAKGKYDKEKAKYDSLLGQYNKELQAYNDSSYLYNNQLKFIFDQLKRDNSDSEYIQGNAKHEALRQLQFARDGINPYIFK